MIYLVTDVFLFGNYVEQHCCVGQLWNIIVCTNLSFELCSEIEWTSKKMPCKRKSGLSIMPENEELAEAVRVFPCLYDIKK